MPRLKRCNLLSLKFARWFIEEDKKPEEDSSSRDLLSLITSNGTAGSRAISFNKKGMPSGNRDHVAENLKFSVTPSVVGIPEQYCAIENECGSPPTSLCTALDPTSETTGWFRKIRLHSLHQASSHQHTTSQESSSSSQLKSSRWNTVSFHARASLACFIARVLTMVAIAKAIEHTRRVMTKRSLKLKLEAHRCLYLPGHHGWFLFRRWCSDSRHCAGSS